jgi:predicted transposase
MLSIIERLGYAESVKLTIGLKLKPTKEQAVLLLETLHRANDAANVASRAAWDNKAFGTFKLQSLVYHSLREKYQLRPRSLSDSSARLPMPTDSTGRLNRPFVGMALLPTMIAFCATGLTM